MDRELLKTGSREVDEATLMQFEKGYLWEVALSRAFGEKAAHQIGEVEFDGIIVTPDGVITELDVLNISRPKSSNYDDSAIIGVEEYKCTALSPDKSPANMWQWLMQVKGYCKMLGVTKCIFRVLHHVAIMHDPGNAYQPWEIVFTQAELDENWQAILNHAKTMEVNNA